MSPSSRRWAVISTNDRHDYLYYAPIVTQQWRRLGFDVFLLYNGSHFDTHPALRMTCALGGHIRRLPFSVGNLHNETYTQVARLFAATFTEIMAAEDMLTTSDVDMLVFQAPPAQLGMVTSWGQDLTCYQHYPICYVSATAGDWLQLFDLTAKDTMATAMDMFVQRWPQYFGEPAKRWVVDQDALTDCINHWRFNARGYVGVDRTLGPDHLLPLGRLDRYNWRYPQGEIVDCHLPKAGYSDDAHEKVTTLFRYLNLENVEWINSYREEYVRGMKS